MINSKVKNFFKISAISFLILVLLYTVILKQIFSSWGASKEELAVVLPGDRLIVEPKINATRAITINATPEKIYPWLIQMGIDKGGLYSYDWLENIFGLKVKSSDSIIEKWQNIKVGDVLLLGPMGGPKLIEMKKDKYILFGGIKPEFGNTWSFNLFQKDKQTTRLVIRSKYSFENSFTNFLIWKVFTEPAHFFMEEKMLRGIKERSELK